MHSQDTTIPLSGQDVETYVWLSILFRRRDGLRYRFMLTQHQYQIGQLVRDLKRIKLEN